MVEVGPAGGYMTKGTVFEGVGSPGSGSGGGLLPVPQVVPGIVQTCCFSRSRRSADVNRCRDNQHGHGMRNQGTSDKRRAAGVAEGGLKPESEIGIGYWTKRSGRSRR